MRFSILVNIAIFTAVLEKGDSSHSEKEPRDANDETVTTMDSPYTSRQFCEDSERCKVEGQGKSERTFIMVKPDGVQRGLIGEIIKRFEQKGFKLVAMKFMRANESLLKEHYADLSHLPFFPGLVKHMSNGPVVAMVWEGLNVVKTGRHMLGETDPANSLPGTIRGDFCIQIGRNIIHGSDSVESAKKEINLWFKNDIVEWNLTSSGNIYE